MDNSNASKKTLGRRKIEIKKIEKKTSLQVTFTKRRTGLFRKASELTVLCGAEIAILVQSPAQKIFAFGHPSVEAVIDRFQMGEAPPPEMVAMSSSSSHGLQIILREDGRSKYEEAVRKLEMEKKRMTEKEGKFWWDEPYEGLELHELEEYLEALEILRNNVSKRVGEMEKLMKLQGGSVSTPSNHELCASASTSSNLLAPTIHDDQPVDYDLYDIMN